MIFADKLISLRKRAGWSQEELANQLNVTRQSVSKWEGAQSIPDLDKIVQLSRLFGVTTDYLLKDELELPDSAPEGAAPALRRVTMEHRPRAIWSFSAGQRPAQRWRRSCASSHRQC